MIFYADTFPVRQPYLSLSPNIKISPSSDSPNFPFSRIGSPKTVSLVSTEVPAGSRALGLPPAGSGLGGRGTNRALAGRARCPAALHTPGTVLQEGWCLPGASSTTASPRVCLCFSKALTASVPRMLLHPPSTAPVSPTSLSPSRSPRAHMLPRSQSTLCMGSGFPLAHFTLNILCTCQAVCSLPG